MVRLWKIGRATEESCCGVVLLILCFVGTRWAAATEPDAVFSFPSTGVVFDAAFDGARLNDCILQEDGTYRIVIRPENEPVNDSAWYAFRVSARAKQTVTIQLTYEGGKHRYHPKISSDGSTWKRVTSDRYRREKGKVTLQVDAGPEGLWIAAQEMVGLAELNAWIDEIADLPFVGESVIGHSVGGRPLRQLTIGTGKPEYAVAIVGRQHPPEVTGTMALMEFVETIVGASDLADEYRQNFKTIVVPLMNPDGVAAGNWRYNLHGVDLNRDWGPFAQPETRAVRDAILPYRAEGTPQLACFLDFHSTHHDVFYVQTGKEPVWLEGFARRWLDALAAATPEYKVRCEPNSGTRPLSKVWARRTMKVSAVIYEVGDNTDRELIRQVARNAAVAMMELLLADVEGVSSESKKAVGAGSIGQ